MTRVATIPNFSVDVSLISHIIMGIGTYQTVLTRISDSLLIDSVQLSSD